MMNTPLPPVSPARGSPPPSAPTALIFGIGQVQSSTRRVPQPIRPATTDVPSPSNPFAGYFSSNYGEGTTSVDNQLATLKEKRRLKALAFDSPGAISSGSPSPSHALQPSRPQSQSSVGVTMPPINAPRPNIPRTPPGATPEAGSPVQSFPRKQYLSTQAPPTEQPSEYPTTDTVTPRKPVAVSAATLKRRQAMEEKERAKATDKVTEGTEPIAPSMRPKGKGQMIPEKVVAPLPPTLSERCKKIEEIVLLLQAKGPQSAALIEAAVANEGKSKPKGTGADAKPQAQPVSHEWICHEKGLQALRSDVFNRWLRLDEEPAILAAAKLMRPSPPDESPRNSPSVSQSKRKTIAPSAIFAPGFFTANAILKAYRDTEIFPILLDDATVKPLAQPPAGYVLNSDGATMYSPTDKEIQLLLTNATVIVRACLACAENGRSTVSKLAVDMIGLLCDTLGVVRLSGYYQPSEGQQLSELMLSPASRALDAHADALIGKLISKGGTASVKFLYEVAAASLFHLLRGLSGSSNKILVGVLLQSLSSNIPKTEKSRILWGDAIAYSLVQRWAMSFLYPNLNARMVDGPAKEAYPQGVLSWMLMSVLVAPSQTELADVACRLAENRRHNSQPFLTISSTAKDIKEIQLRSLTAVDILLADGSPEVREAGKRALLALLLLLEEFVSINSSNASSASPSPSKLNARGPPMGPSPTGGLVAQLLSSSTTSAAQRGLPAPTPSTPGPRSSREAVPTLEALIDKTFMDAKAKLDRMREAVGWARQAYQEGLAPLLLIFGRCLTSQRSGADSQVVRSALTPPTKPPLPVRSPPLNATRKETPLRTMSPAASPTTLPTTPSSKQPAVPATPSSKQPAVPTTSSTKLAIPASPSSKQPPEEASCHRSANGRANATLDLQQQLRSYAEGSGPGSRGGLATPQTPMPRTAPSEAELLAITLTAEQQAQVSAWCSQDNPPPHLLAVCIIAVHSLIGSKDREREAALRYLLYCKGANQYHLGYAMGTALLDGLLLKSTSPSNRVQGMSLQLLTMLVTLNTPRQPLAFTIGPDCVDALAGKSVGCLTTAMASANNIVSAAAQAILTSMLGCVCGLLIEGTSEEEEGAYAAICSLSSLMYDVISTAFATRNPTARTALLTAAHKSLVQKSLPRLQLADVRFLIDTCGKIIISEIEGLVETVTSTAMGTSFNASFSLTGTSSGRQRTPATCAMVCVAALQLYSDLNQCPTEKVRDYVKATWATVVSPAIVSADKKSRRSSGVDGYLDDFEDTKAAPNTASEAVSISLTEFMSDVVTRVPTPLPIPAPPATGAQVEKFLHSLSL